MSSRPTTPLTRTLRTALMCCAGLSVLCPAQADEPKAARAPDVIPTIFLHCTACHGARRKEAGLDLRSRAAMLKGAKLLLFDRNGFDERLTSTFPARVVEEVLA